METLETTTAKTGTLPARRARPAAADHRLESDAISDALPPTAAEAQPAPVQAVDSIGCFTEVEIRKLHNDDAMAAGMIAMILSLAFLVLLSLTIGVNIWMQSISR